MGRAGQAKLLSNGCGFENDENMCLLPELHYKLIMNQKAIKKGKTEALRARWEVTTVKSSPSKLPLPTQPLWPTHCPSGEGSWRIWTDRCTQPWPG